MRIKERYIHKYIIILYKLLNYIITLEILLSNYQEDLNKTTKKE